MVHDYSSTWEAELSEFKANLVYSLFQGHPGLYTERP